MAKKITGIDALLSGVVTKTPATDEAPSINGALKHKNIEHALAEKCRPRTFNLSPTLVAKIAFIAEREDVKTKALVNQALALLITKWECKNEEIPQEELVKYKQVVHRKKDHYLVGLD